MTESLARRAFAENAELIAAGHLRYLSLNLSPQQFVGGWAQRRLSAMVASGERLAWKSSVHVSAGACMLKPGSVNVGGTWQVAQVPLPAKIAFPRLAAARLKLPFGGLGAFSESS